MQIWIIGGGRFGLKSVKRLLQGKEPHKITIVERDRSRCQAYHPLPVACICQEGVAFLAETFSKMADTDWIVPMVPIHLAFEWMKQVLRGELKLTPRMIPEEMVQRFPNPVRGGIGKLYSSLADFRCPDNCSEPASICTYRQQPRPYRLYQRMEAEQENGVSAVVIRSRQILPGIGGYQRNDLKAALDRVKNGSAPILLATACKCHGVMDLFQTHHIAKMEQKEYK